MREMKTCRVNKKCAREKLKLILKLDFKEKKARKKRRKETAEIYRFLGKNYKQMKSLN